MMRRPVTVQLTRLDPIRAVAAPPPPIAPLPVPLSMQMADAARDFACLITSGELNPVAAMILTNKVAAWADEVQELEAEARSARR